MNNEASPEQQRLMDAPARILLVDDRPSNLDVLELVLAPLDQLLVRANSGEEALRHLLKEKFAVILLDVQMPKLDGIDTARLIRAGNETKDSRYQPRAGPKASGERPGIPIFRSEHRDRH